MESKRSVQQLLIKLNFPEFPFFTRGEKKIFATSHCINKTVTRLSFLIYHFVLKREMSEVCHFVSSKVRDISLINKMINCILINSITQSSRDSYMRSFMLASTEFVLLSRLHIDR